MDERSPEPALPAPILVVAAHPAAQYEEAAARGPRRELLRWVEDRYVEIAIREGRGAPVAIGLRNLSGAGIRAQA